MISIKDTCYYNDVVKELNYPFANIFLFNGMVVSEIKEGVVFSWDNHAEIIAQDVSSYYGSNGEDIVYISNRINSYSVVAADWIKFFNHNYKLKVYAVVGSSKGSFLNTLIENLFFSKKIKRFNDIITAINWAENYDFAATPV